MNASSDYAINKVQGLYDSQQLKLGNFLDVLVRAVEVNPSNTAIWYKLVHTLVTARHLPTQTNNLKSEDEANDDVKLNDDQCWWMSRKYVWREDYFISPPSSSVLVKPEFASIVLDAIDADLFFIENEHSDQDNFSDIYKSTIFLADTNPPCSDHKRNSFDTFKEQLSTDPLCESICLRIVIAYHMFGDCGFVRDSIWWLAVKHWKSKQRGHTANAYFTSLKWLSLWGFDVLAHLRKKNKPNFLK